ncbi:hypothetical protein LOCC1_G003358 [Lachnellula occidentalis]|uniref:BTB domain-containing protein n=1 Tax=Lachnellula occidentalis TaxID=215460 RepID=A0A8H8UEC3_9HELO|nr:hypothetical protein LOCC1_G003358 [Lachnellula occidentalis]
MASITGKRKAPEDSSPEVSASKRVQLSSAQNEKGKRPSFMGPQTMVKVNVSLKADDKKQEFLVYKEFICYYSPVFAAAFNGNFEESANQSIDIVDVSPRVFGLFINWLYTQNVVQDQDNAPTTGVLGDLWLLGDRFLIPRLQNETLVALEQRRSEKRKIMSSASRYRRVYDNTVQGSPLRRYITQTTATAFGPDVAIPHQYDYYPPELLFDMFDFLRTRTGPVGRRVEYSEDELKQFFVEEEETESKKD